MTLLSLISDVLSRSICWDMARIEGNVALTILFLSDLSSSLVLIAASLSSRFSWIHDVIRPAHLQAVSALLVSVLSSVDHFQHQRTDSWCSSATYLFGNEETGAGGGPVWALMNVFPILLHRAVSLRSGGAKIALLKTCITN